MEAVAYVAGEAWTDRPGSVSPVIAALLQGLNDAMSDRDRQALKPLIELVQETRGDAALEATRSWMVIDWHCRTWPAAWLRATGCTGEAMAIESAGDIVDATSLRAALQPLTGARVAAEAKRAAAMKGFARHGRAAMAAARVDETDPAISTAVDSFRAGGGWPAIRAAQKAVPLDGGWDEERTARWADAWDAAGSRLAVTYATAQLAGVRAVFATSAWQAEWFHGAAADESWALVREHAFAAGRDSALALALDAAWEAADAPNHLTAWTAATGAADGAVRATVTFLQRSAIDLVTALVGAAAGSRDAELTDARR